MVPSTVLVPAHIAAMSLSQATSRFQLANRWSTTFPHSPKARMPSTSISSSFEACSSRPNGIFEAIAPMSNKGADGVERADAHAIWARNAK
jgi:hypothetical protein